MARYNDTIIRQDKNKQRYLSTEDYPSFDKKDTDVIIRARFGQRMDNLANRFYNNPDLWWVISKANPNKIKRDSFFIEPGLQIRIPMGIDAILDDFETENSK